MYGIRNRIYKNTNIINNWRSEIKNSRTIKKGNLGDLASTAKTYRRLRSLELKILDLIIWKYQKIIRPPLNYIRKKSLI